MLAAAFVVISFWIEPCTQPREVGCQEGDQDLIVWALNAWSRASGDVLKFKPEKKEDQAQFRFYWAGTRGGLYGEARPIEVNGKRGATVFIRPSITKTSDLLLRDVIVYLTCLHESGHALGLPHTGQFDDIMYNFQLGGDLEEYFQRHRRKVRDRGDIRTLGGYSRSDINRLNFSIRQGFLSQKGMRSVESVPAPHQKNQTRSAPVQTRD